MFHKKTISSLYNLCIIKVIFLNNYHILVCSRTALYVLPMPSCKKWYTLKGLKFNKINNFYYSICEFLSEICFFFFWASAYGEEYSDYLFRFVTIAVIHAKTQAVSASMLLNHHYKCQGNKKGEYYLYTTMNIVLAPQIFWKDLWDAQRSVNHTLRSIVVKEIQLYPMGNTGHLNIIGRGMM